MKAYQICLCCLLIIFSGCKKEELPTITTGSVTSINQTSAICNAYIISQGSSDVISKGVCWATSTDPTIFNNTVRAEDAGIGGFSIKITGLGLHTEYYVRAYAINGAGTAYGKTKVFITDAPYLPGVRTYPYGFTSITTTSTKASGEVTSDGGAEITDRGFCWGRSLNPTLSDNHVSAGSGTGTFNATLTGLQPNTDYMVRAYATNITGTAYGDQMQCSTKFEPDPDYPVDPNYPTTFYKLDSVTLSQKKAAFDQRNRYIQTTLNEFGFCASPYYLEKDSPPYINNLPENQAIDSVKKFISKNASETGMNNPDELTINWSYNYTGPAYNYWRFSSPTEKINGIEVVSTFINFMLMNGEMQECESCWYPDVYIPASYVLDQQQAKSLLIGRILTYTDWGGYPSYYTIISPDNVNSAGTRLVIFPLNNGQNIQLRVTWEITLLEYKIYVDVMTGEIVYRECMMIS